MRGRTFIKLDGDIDPIAGDEPAGGRHNHRLRRFVRLGQGEQDAKRVAFEEMAEAGRAMANRKKEFGSAVDAPLTVTAPSDRGEGFWSEGCRRKSPSSVMRERQGLAAPKIGA
jgi:hypothetical protein